MSLNVDNQFVCCHVHLLVLPGQSTGQNFWVRVCQAVIVCCCFNVCDHSSLEADSLPDVSCESTDLLRQWCCWQFWASCLCDRYSPHANLRWHGFSGKTSAWTQFQCHRAIASVLFLSMPWLVRFPIFCCFHSVHKSPVLVIDWISTVWWVQMFYYSRSLICAYALEFFLFGRHSLNLAKWTLVKTVNGGTLMDLAHKRKHKAHHQEGGEKDNCL